MNSAAMYWRGSSSARAFRLRSACPVVIISTTGRRSAIGAIAGYLGGWVDDLIGRVMDVLLAFPGMLLAIALVAMLGPSLTHVVLALTVIGHWVGYARLVRGQILALREMEYIQSARAIGAGPTRVILRHLVPATWPSLVVQGTLGMAGAMLSEASLSFLGLGVQPPTPELGRDARRGAVAFVRRAARHDLSRTGPGGDRRSCSTWRARA